MDPVFCPILALAIHMEHALMNGRMSTDRERDQSLFGISKKIASSHFGDVVDEDGFPAAKEGPLGTHSIRKFPATYARRNGCQTDDIDARGRWKRKRGVVDRYIDVAIPYADAKVASILAIGGPIKYCPRLGAGILDN